MPNPAANTAAWIKPFRSILELERSNRFDNRAVTGGLDRFLEHWAADITAFLETVPQAEPLARTPYAELSLAQREQWADQWLALLSAGPITAPQETAAPAAPPPSALKTRQARRPAAAGPPPGLTVDAPITSLKRVDEKLAARLNRLEVATVRDLLYLFPRRHIDYSRTVKIAELQFGQEVTVSGNLSNIQVVPLGQSGRLQATQALLTDDTGSLRVSWIGQSYMARRLKPDTPVNLSGKVDSFQGRLVLESPEYEEISRGQTPVHTGRLLPVYPLTAGLTGRHLRSLAWQALNEWLGGIDESLPAALLSRAGLMPLRQALHQAHYPDNFGQWAQARRRLAFDELLTLQLSVLARRHRNAQDVAGVTIAADPALLDRIIQSLPFTLTNAQRRCLDEILADLHRGTPPMSRLLQGEVGSGKTVVVLAALLAVIAAGYQGAIMVPTEVLAEQHFQTVANLLGGMGHIARENNIITAYCEALERPVTVGLLTGSIRARPRRQLTALAAEGGLDLLIGTHALIQNGVELPNLALAVMDEQHRFGVMQRSALRQKSQENPHTLVMSATPIPRTLTLTLYGDLDLSTLDELPPGRQEILTRWFGPERRGAVYGFIQKHTRDGRQAFIVHPLIDESDSIEAKAATEEYARLSREVFPQLRLALLHGRMTAADKDKAMRQFRDGELDILVTTAVVEVGIDIPNANVMLIEGADRFGLSQLHQFRGRVGRGAHKSYCILMSDAPSEIARERLTALEQNQDGFKLAEIDLEMRGPGDFFGTRQSGLPNLRMAQLSDRELLDQARQEAARLMQADPELTNPEHAELAAQVTRFTEKVSAEFT